MTGERWFYAFDMKTGFGITIQTSVNVIKVHGFTLMHYDSKF